MILVYVLLTCLFCLLAFFAGVEHEAKKRRHLLMDEVKKCAACRTYIFKTNNKLVKE